VPTIGHDNAYLALQGEQTTLLVDCASSPLLKLQEAGVDPLRVEYLILTHFHPDHMYGFPMLMLGLWLLGRSTPLHVLAEAETLQAAEALLSLFRPQDWPGFQAPIYHRLDLARDRRVLHLPDLDISGCPAEHILPSVALKFVDRSSGQTLVYSGDTSPCERVARLARGAAVLVHEASGKAKGHSSAAEAGWVAARARVDRLYLVHYDARVPDLSALVTEAREQFAGPVELAQDMQSFTF
jgi:ribonuclease Z